MFGLEVILFSIVAFKTLILQGSIVISDTREVWWDVLVTVLLQMFS